jgi:SAM-dependent methyltransferase
VKVPSAAALLRASYRELPFYDAAEWYDADYAGLSGDDAFYQLATKQAARTGLVVEVGAGTGRVTLPLVRAGRRVLAVEPNLAMQAQLTKRFRRADVAMPELVTADVAGLPSIVSSAAAVLFPFNGVLHLMDEQALHDGFSAMASVLSPGGRLAFDVTAPYWDAIAFGPTDWGRFDERVHPSGRRFYTCDRGRYHGPSRIMYNDVRYLLEGEENGVQVSLVQRMWTFQQLLRVVVRVGLEVELLFSDLDLTAFHEGGVRMLLCARKR